MESLGQSFKEIIKDIQQQHNLDIDMNNIKELQRQRDEQTKIEFSRKLIEQGKRRMFRSSLISDYNDLEQTFDDFNVITNGQQEELLHAQNIAHRIKNGEVGNFTFSGTAGAGKTMLAISIMNDIYKSNSPLKCLFVSVAMYVKSQIDASKSFDTAVKNKAYAMEHLIEKCDVLVFDDLGSESTFQQNANGELPQAYDSIQRHISLIADKRKSKTNIITTNHTSAELQSIYNDKIYSRIIAKKRQNAIAFKSQDMRNV